MGGVDPDGETVLLADADVLIDYRDAALEILELVAAHMGRLVVLAPVLEEVRGLGAAECAQLGMEVVAVETDRLAQASEVETRVSFNDCLCMVACREEGWTCVTNDGALRRLCRRHGVKTRFGLGLMVDLVAAGALPRRRALAVARRMQRSNPLHINEGVVERFKAALRA